MITENDVKLRKYLVLVLWEWLNMIKWQQYLKKLVTSRAIPLPTLLSTQPNNNKVANGFLFCNL